MEAQMFFEIPRLKESMSVIFKATLFLFLKKKSGFISSSITESLLKIFNPLFICIDYKHTYALIHPLSK